MTRIIDDALDVEHLRALLATRALGANLLIRPRSPQFVTSSSAPRRPAPAALRSRLLPPGYKRLGGNVREREPGRYELTKVPGRIRDRAREAAMRPGSSALTNGSRSRRTGSRSSGYPLAEFVCPGHPLLEATIDLVLQDHRELLRRGALLIDEPTRRTRCEPSSTSSTPSSTDDQPRRAPDGREPPPRIRRARGGGCRRRRSSALPRLPGLHRRGAQPC